MYPLMSAVTRITARYLANDFMLVRVAVILETAYRHRGSPSEPICYLAFVDLPY